MRGFLNNKYFIWKCMVPNKVLIMHCLDAVLTVGKSKILLQRFQSVFHAKGNTAELLLAKLYHVLSG